MEHSWEYCKSNCGLYCRDCKDDILEYTCGVCGDVLCASCHDLERCSWCTKPFCRSTCSPATIVPANKNNYNNNDNNDNRLDSSVPAPNKEIIKEGEKLYRNGDDNDNRENEEDEQENSIKDSYQEKGRSPQDDSKMRVVIENEDIDDTMIRKESLVRTCKSCHERALIDGYYSAPRWEDPRWVK